MKQLITICLVAGLIFAVTGPARADDIEELVPWWADGDGTVFAEWDTWTGFPGPMPPDEWESNPSGLPAPEAYANVIGTPSLLSDYMGRTNVIELTADYDLDFYLPNFPSNDYKEISIQVTYYPTVPEQLPWFDVEAPELEGMSDPVSWGEYDHGDGWITEAWSFEIWPNPEEEHIFLNFESGGGGPLYPAYVDQVVIDTWCVPEPATMALLGLGALSLLRKKRRA